ncbi:putative hydrogenase maturation protease [Mycobacterium xenopi 4042]|uniref:Putative hydrogenase maturation protease n=1 Tax=Mycobacterium xenopi 4042 TaxID=1299334 RepID=X7ZXY5_MYCXE|nr:putative hydrogenase maturation protease [Mycobacterium xenopi 4042]
MPSDELEQLPPLEGLHTHSFRWDHAIAFARWVLADECPTDITIFLIEAGDVTFGAELSEPVTAAMEKVMDMIEAVYLTPLRPPKPTAAAELTVEFTPTATFG